MCGNDRPAECLCLLSSEMMRSGSQDKMMRGARPVHLRTESGKLKM
ncbi:unnamed protein product [Ectocarpus fasciculatus]